MQTYTFVTINDTSLEKINEFNRFIHGDEVKDAALALRTHPLMKDEYYIALEDEAGRIACAVQLLPVVWNYCGLALRGGELAIMGTHPDCRNQGLATRVVDRLLELCRRDGFVFSSITGIPEFYLRFGYSYAFELENDIRMPIAQNPLSANCSIRNAVSADNEYIGRAYAQSMRDHDVYTLRDGSLNEFILNKGTDYCFYVERYIVSRDGKMGGYFAISPLGFGEGLIVQEIYCDDESYYVDIFAFCSSLAAERGKDYIRLNISSHSDALRWAQENGAEFRGSYSYYLKIVSPLLFLQQIKPVLESRLASSRFRDFSGSFGIGLFNDGLELNIEQGKIQNIHEVKLQNYDLMVPKHMFADLVFGVRSFEHMRIKSTSFSLREPFATPGEDSLAAVLFPMLKCYAHWAY